MVPVLVTLPQAGEVPDPMGATLYTPTPRLEESFEAQVWLPLAQCLLRQQPEDMTRLEVTKLKTGGRCWWCPWV